jgi:hypothetical protein
MIFLTDYQYSILSVCMQSEQNSLRAKKSFPKQGVCVIQSFLLIIELYVSYASMSKPFYFHLVNKKVAFDSQMSFEIKTIFGLEDLFNI